MTPFKRPSPVRGTFAVAIVAILWIYLRYLFGISAIPLTYALPLLCPVWTRRVWHVWSMAALFILATFLQLFWIPLPETLTAEQIAQFVGFTLFNIVVGAGLVHAIINMRARIAADLARIMKQNKELGARSEDVAQQNEEIKQQAEELAQQNEEIESQAEELTRQNEELHETNERLMHREQILQGLLESSRTPETGRLALAEICRRSLRILGKPTECIAILKRDGDGLRVKVQASIEGGPTVPQRWPMADSIASVVLGNGKTAYVSDLRKEPRLAAPFGETGGVQSILATPLNVAGASYGLVVACSSQEGHWSQEQFHVLEWIAAQSGLIAEALRWQDELAQRARDIEAANRAKDQFLAMLSHELRTPLTPVLAAAGVLENDSRIPADAREDLRMIRRNVTIQSRLIDDLLDLTKLERGKFELNLERLEIFKLLKETAAIVAPDLDAKDQQLTLELGAIDGCFVTGDGARLQQVFWNLLKNAIKFSPPKGQIRLAAEMSSGPAQRIVIIVADSGVGLNETDLDRIFRPFEQVMAGGKQRNGDAGLGLGLAIAKAIVDLHQGVIRAESAGIGKGATFSVELPLMSEPSRRSEALSTRPQAKVETKSRTLRILLVEDHGDTGRVIGRLLRNAGFRVDLSETANAALQLASNSRYDLVISDLGLPDASGLELMPQLLAEQPWLRGICLSGYGMEDDLQACRTAGFSEHLTKPVDMQRLLAAINRVASVIEANRDPGLGSRPM